MIRQVEVCESCGDDTGPGTPLYSDRRIATDAAGHRRYLCAPCAQRMASPPRRQGMSDEERRKLESAAALFGGFVPGGH
jgi:hypothetical protein